MVQIAVRDYDHLAELLATAVARGRVTEKLFVYGIFLGQDNREEYGMLQAEYATQPGYKTVGEYIVKAVKSDSPRDSLTGLLINNTDAINWQRLDALEAGYKRIAVEQQSNIWIWVKGADKRLQVEKVPIELGEDMESIEEKVFEIIDSLSDGEEVTDFRMNSEITYMYVDPSVDGKDYSTYVR